MKLINTIFSNLYLRIPLSCIFVLFISYSCNKDDALNSSEMNISEKRQGYINFETLTSKIGGSNAFKSNLKYFNNTAPLQSKGVEFVNAYVDTTIIYLKESEFSDYFTLRIVNNNPQDKPNAFYNLVFEQHKATGEVTSTIVQFLPALEWLFDKSQPFKGTILTYDNQLFSIDDLEGGLNGEVPKAINPCVISIDWVCTENNHPPGTPGCGGGWVITLGPGCSNGGGGSGGDGGDGGDPGDGGSHGSGNGGGGGSSSGSTQTVVIEICDGYSHDGGPANSEDCEDDYAAYFTPFICEDYVDFALINYINTWAPRNLGVATAFANYLANNFPKDDDDDCAEIDFVEKVIKDISFKDTDTECIHNKMKSNPNSIYSKMFAHFNGTTGKFLHLKVGDTPSGDWGITRGNDTSSQSYTITVDNDINTNGSNLMKYVTLCHEMIHAYMFSSLEENGVITFDSNGEPVTQVICGGSEELNNLTVANRFTKLICALQASGADTSEWTHELFNKNVFDVEDYRQKLENMLVNEYDWNSESHDFRTEAQNIFGNNWKQEVAKAISWIGLENTNGHLDYLNSFGTQLQKLLYVQNIRSKIATTNNNC